MFDNLICNIDPNLGNWLVDSSWNLVLSPITPAHSTTKEGCARHEVMTDRSESNGIAMKALERRDP
jgi:hypothetical protein